MPRKLKVYQTSIGFSDLVIAAPSMRAALEAWGAASNLFHQGFAKEADDRAAVDAALDKPGIVLKRPVGSDNPFSESIELPDDLAPAEPSKRKRVKPAPKPMASDGGGDAAARRAAAAYKKQRQKDDAKREREEAAEAKAHERREVSVASAQSELVEATRKHNDTMAALETKRSAIEKRIKAEEDRWTGQRDKLEAALKRARSR